MDNVPRCNRPEYLEEFDSILEGTKPLAPWDIRNAKQHLEDCPHCAYRNADGVEKLAWLQRGVENDVANELVSLEFAAADARRTFETIIKQEELSGRRDPAPRDENDVIHFLEDWKSGLQQEELSDEKGETARSLLLAQPGKTIVNALDYVHEMAGLGQFSPMPDPEDSDAEDARAQCAPFIAGLAESTQSFIFRATFASELTPQILGSEPLEEIEDDVRGIGLDPSSLQRIIEYAAPLVLRDYLVRYANRSPLSAVDRAHGSSESRFSREMHNQFASLKSEFSTGLLAMKEKIDSLVRARRRACEFEHDITETLGIETYLRLSPQSRRDLQLAEFYFAENQEPDDYTASVLYFVRAFEEEFRRRIYDPLVTGLLRRGFTQYPREEDLKSQYPILLRRGKPVVEAGPGKVLGYLKHDTTVRQIVQELQLDVDQLATFTSQLRTVRNPAIHGEPVKYNEAQKVRELVLGRSGVLKFLIEGRN